MKIRTAKTVDDDITFVLHGKLNTLLDVVQVPDQLASMKEVKLWHAKRVIKACEGDLDKAAAALGIGRTTLYRWGLAGDGTSKPYHNQWIKKL